MEESYIEWLVKRKDPIYALPVKIIMVLVCAFSVLLALQTVIGVVIMTAAGIGTYFIFLNLSVEYEYLFVNGELDIDMIMSKSKRKRVKSLQLAEADLVAPLNSHRMDYYNGNQKMKIMDFSSGIEDHKRYAMITRDSGETCKVILELDDALANTMKNSAPSKVFLD